MPEISELVHSFHQQLLKYVRFSRILPLGITIWVPVAECERIGGYHEAGARQMNNPFLNFGFSVVLAFLVGCLVTWVACLYFAARSRGTEDRFESARLQVNLEDARTALRAEELKSEDLNKACQRLSEQLSSQSSTVIAGSAEDLDTLRAEMSSLRAEHAEAEHEWTATRTQFAQLLRQKNAKIEQLSARCSALETTRSVTAKPQAPIESA